MTSCESITSVSSGVITMPPNVSARGVEVVNVAASGGGGSSSGGGSAGSGGDGGNGCTEVGSVSCLRRNHGTSQDLSDSSCPPGFVVHAPLQSGNSIINADQAFVQDNTDPLSYFLASWQNDHDPFDFGVRSVADGTFGGRQPTCEQLKLFRSHRLMQAEAVSVVMCNAYSSNASVRQHFGLIGGTVAHQVSVKLFENTNSTIERIRVLGRDGIPNQQLEIINEERKTSHRMIAEILDNTSSKLRDILDSGYSESTGNDYGGSRSFGSSSNGYGSSSCGRNYFSTAIMEPGLGSASGNRSMFSSSMLELPSSSSGAHQIATSSSWEGSSNTPCTTLAPLASVSPPIKSTGLQQQQQHQQQPSVQSNAGKRRSSVFALTHLRDRPLHAPLVFNGGLSNAMGYGVDERQPIVGASSLMGPLQTARVSDYAEGLHAGGSTMPEVPMSFNHNGVSASTVVDTWNAASGYAGYGEGGGGKEAMWNDFKMDKKSLLFTKMSPKLLAGSRSAHSNRKGSRHRLTPQAKEILEEWLAKHWLNPYPNEAEKLHLSKACKITVTQVNNWMMNVRVRRCRTKKIGVATGLEQITYPSSVPNTVAVNRPMVRSQHGRPGTDVPRLRQDTMSTPLNSDATRGSTDGPRGEPDGPFD